MYLDQTQGKETVYKSIKNKMSKTQIRLYGRETESRNKESKISIKE